AVETMTSLPEMHRGRVSAALVKVVVDQHRDEAPMPGGPRSDELSYAKGQGQMAYYRILETKGEARILRTSSLSITPLVSSSRKRCLASPD
ncbi:MAG: hypothetical protein QGH33_15530, partial [Pirellulaceae bacterium]|nr:hypothetical protein [Pirellulaceae bacterium]